jgi:hypothetical protein
MYGNTLDNCQRQCTLPSLLLTNEGGIKKWLIYRLHPARILNKGDKFFRLFWTVLTAAINHRDKPQPAGIIHS